MSSSLSERWKTLPESWKWKIGLGTVGAFFLLILVCAGGGGPEESKPAANPFKQKKEYGRVIVVAVDLSGSFLHLMTRGGKAYEFMTKLVSRYMRNGVDDRIVLAQISGNDRPLIFDGTVQDIHRTFPSETAFNKYLKSKADPNGSRVHDGIADTLKYVLRYPGVKERKVKSALIILSDMDDNASKKGSDNRLNSILKDYADVGGAVGIYFCDEKLQSHWDDRLKSAEFRHHIVTNKVTANPDLPDIE